jgi:hypothetical protein
MEAIIREYSRDKNFGKLYRNMVQRLQNSPKAERITTFESFRLDAKTKLLFFHKDGGSEKLYIPDKFGEQCSRWATTLRHTLVQTGLATT